LNPILAPFGAGIVYDQEVAFEWLKKELIEKI